MRAVEFVAEGKIKLSTDPDWYGAEVGNYKATGPVVNISADQLVGFEPDDKMNQPASKANVKKIIAGLEQGDKLPPLLVCKYKDGYQVLDGHHRFWAYKSSGVKSIPVQVVPARDVEEVGRQGVAEAPLADYQPLGDFNKPGPFRGADKKLIPHPVNQLKAQKFFEKTPFDFRLFFSNISGTGKYSEYGVMDPETVKIIFGDAGEQIVTDHENAITVVYVGNSGDSKVMLTPWMMAHRLGHAIQSGTRGRATNQQHPWKAGEDHFFGQVNSMLEQYYGKSGQRGGNLKFELTPEYNALFNAMGTQRSSRSGEIRRPYEFLYEIFAQYLGTGTVSFNALPVNLGYGRQAWGNPNRYLNIKPEYRDEAARKQAAEVLSYDMELMFNDALSDAVGKILVM